MAIRRPSEQPSGRPIERRPGARALPSPQQMAARLRVRLRKARTAVERDLGHSLLAIAPQKQQQQRRRRQQQQQAAQAWPVGLGARTQSCPHGDFSALVGAATATLQRHQSGQEDAPSPLPPPLLLLDANSEDISDVDSDSEIAHTILMLATPPAARGPSLGVSPAQCSGRRLSFSHCLDGTTTTTSRPVGPALESRAEQL
ncbi:hypothetical protein H4R18_000020 [Coemansia javaensis]|uniref:Uncharacterized protein n=1 Tax=Coemansia javaensis TaxID=2761396 RepID=A0A9W8HQM5_9FUNG|nr:hypothetical protein H4R18_000020 [Coemansia javaensis]